MATSIDGGSNMNIQEFLEQYWVLEVKSNKKQTSKRKEPLFHEPVICNHFQIDWYGTSFKYFTFDYYLKVELEDGDFFYSVYNWQTGKLRDIVQENDKLQIITNEYIYTFTKTTTIIAKKTGLL